MHPLLVRANEVQVGRIKLASEGVTEGDAVTIFKSSSDRFRLVLETSPPFRQDQRLLIPQTLYACEDRLIPRYALPTLTLPALEIAIFSRNEEILYKFDSFLNLCRTQSALTGYNVSHDQSGIRVQFSDEASSLDCLGRIQLWQEPVGPRDATDDVGRSSSGSTFTSTSPSGESQSRYDSLATSHAASATVRWTAGGWEAESIKLPAIVIFTLLVDRRKRKRYATIAIELEPGINIDPTECKCCRDYDSCSKLVLTSGKRRPFTIRVSYSEIDSSGHPNPNTFDILPFRIPRHPRFQNLTTKRTEYLVLKFNSLREKINCHEELLLRFRVRDKQIQDQRDFADKITHLQDRPQRIQQQQPPSLMTSPVLSRSGLSSVASLPPQLDLPDSGPYFLHPLTRRTTFESSLSGGDGNTAKFTSGPSRTNSTVDTLHEDLAIRPPNAVELDGADVQSSAFELSAVQACQSAPPKPLLTKSATVPQVPYFEEKEVIAQLPRRRSLLAPEVASVLPTTADCKHFIDEAPPTAVHVQRSRPIPDWSAFDRNKPYAVQAETAAPPIKAGKRSGFWNTFKF